MAIIKCKMCGGDMEIAADKTFGTCEYCGSTMTLPKVDDEQRAAAFNRGNHFRRVGEFDKALAVYERIVAENDSDAEAHWCCALCRFGIEYVEDPATYEWLPTCHRASFDSFLEDVDYLAALEHSDGITRRQYQKDGAKIAEVQRGILATSQNEEPFDVFICYKESDENGQRTRDSLLAQEIYYQLTEQGRRVFFARITLEDKAGTEYEPYIFAALNSAKVMVAVGTKAEHFNAVWVKNEWSRFLALMRKDRSKLLLPCYRDMDPYDLPEQLSVLQSYDMAKIGFIQDLTRGISKVLDADKPENTSTTVKETVVVQQSASGNIQALLDRGNMALEDGEWAKADGFFEEVLNQDAKCAEAYLGKAMAEEKSMDLDAFMAWLNTYIATGEKVYVEGLEAEEHIDDIVKRCVVPEYLAEETLRRLYVFDFYIESTVAKEAIHRQRMLDRFDDNRNIERAVAFSTGKTKQRLTEFRAELERIHDAYLEEARQEEAKNRAEKTAQYQTFLQEADAKAETLCREALEAREKDYQTAVDAMNSAKTIEHFAAAKKAFMAAGLTGYKDSSEHIQHCNNAIADLKEQERIEKERQTAAAQAEAKAASERQKRKTKKIAIIAAIVTCVVVVAIVVATQVIIPNSKYNDAEVLFNNGEYEAAISVFEALDGYKDSDDKILEAENCSEYNRAMGLMESGEYSKALGVFRKLGNFRDCEAKVAECDGLQKEADYTSATELLDNGALVDAITAFEALGDYKDSSKKYSEAIEELEAIKAEKIPLIEAAMQTSLSDAYALIMDMPDGIEEIAEWEVICRQYAPYCGTFVGIDNTEESFESDFYLQDNTLRWRITNKSEAFIDLCSVKFVVTGNNIRFYNDDTDEFVYTDAYDYFAQDLTVDNATVTDRYVPKDTHGALSGAAKFLGQKITVTWTYYDEVNENGSPVEDAKENVAGEFVFEKVD